MAEVIVGVVCLVIVLGTILLLDEDFWHGYRNTKFLDSLEDNDE